MFHIPAYFEAGLPIVVIGFVFNMVPFSQPLELERKNIFAKILKPKFVREKIHFKIVQLLRENKNKFPRKHENDSFRCSSTGATWSHASSLVFRLPSTLLLLLDPYYLVIF